MSARKILNQLEMPWNVTKHNKQSLGEKDFQSNFHLLQSNVDLGVFSVISLGAVTRYWIINQSLFGGGGKVIDHLRLKARCIGDVNRNQVEESRRK